MWIVRQYRCTIGGLLRVAGPGVATHGIARLKRAVQAVIKAEIQIHTGPNRILWLSRRVIRVDGQRAQLEGFARPQGIDESQGQ